MIRQSRLNSTLFDRILVCDNASADNTADVARSEGAEVVFEARPGYGAACLFD
jgi:glycosyltransferase involved in cell wall biosynthesis